jgi:uncharacterized lipoprotein YmbA
MKFIFTRFQWTAVAFICLTVVGCIGGQSAPTQFYMLDPVTLETTSPPPAAGKTPVHIALDPVEVPAYLNRPQIVTHLDRAEYQLDEFNRWMEPLGDTLTRVIAENLSEMLATDGIDILSMSRPVETQYTVTVQILRMDGKLGQRMVLVARWSLFNLSDNALLLTRRSVFTETVSDTTYQGFLQAQNQMIESLSRAIADGIRPIVLQGVGS